MMKTNKLREILNSKNSSIGTRISSAWPVITEAIGSTGKFDYIEFLAEYAPFSHTDLENICRAAELHNMSSMIKVDFQNRGYIAQKGMASGFQAVLFTDIRNADEAKESIKMVKPETPEDGGIFGYPNRRWIGYQPNNPQMTYAKMVRETVVAIMIEKQEAMENIEAICAVQGLDMVQFGPSDYSMSRGWNLADHRDEAKQAEHKMIEIALKNGVHPRCEINTADEAKYYIDLGVKHFCLGDELRNNMTYWNNVGGALKDIVEKI